MSLQPEELTSIPEETVRVARAAFPRGHVYMHMRDELGPIYRDEQFASLYPSRGQPAASPARLALVTIMQFAEGLSDRQAATAVRDRIAWKYALGLELTDPGIDASVLAEFRSRLLSGNAETLLFETMVERLRERGLLKAGGRARTDSTHILAAIRTLNRLELVGETMRHALNTLARVLPSWLVEWVPSTWFDRYARRFEEFRLPTERTERYALAEQIGADGFFLLEVVCSDAAPAWVREVPAVETLRQVWLQQFVFMEGHLQWRQAEDLPPGALLIQSPYDIEARYSKKRETEWTGYKVHLTETCDDDGPHLITTVETTTSTTTDYEVTPTIHEHLAARELLPDEHLLDTGYLTAQHLVDSRRDYGVELVGPVAEERSWQARAKQGFDLTAFVIDWDAQQARCPQGHLSHSWSLNRNHQPPEIHIRFRYSDCTPCPVRALCTKAATLPRSLTIRTREAFEALQAARQRQQTEAFREQVAARAGVEGTLSQGVAIADLRRARYIGLAKTHLQHLCIALGLNVLRIGDWFAEKKRHLTPTSAFAALAPAPS